MPASDDPPEKRPATVPPRTLATRARVAQVLRRIRSELGMTQAELAARLGMSATNLKRIESGRIEPRQVYLDRLRALTGYDAAAHLLGGDGDPAVPVEWMARAGELSASTRIEPERQWQVRLPATQGGASGRIVAESFAVVLGDDSLDRRLAFGSVLVCVPFAREAFHARPGGVYVLVRHHRARGLEECVAREYHVAPSGERWWQPAATRPTHAAFSAEPGADPDVDVDVLGRAWCAHALL